MNEITCAQLSELASELALDTLNGEERAAALVHLEGCAPCRHEVSRLTEAVEALLVACAPAVEPPPGFDQRVVDRVAALAATEPVTPVPAHVARLRRSRAPRILAAAAVLVLVVSAAVVGLTQLRSDDTQALTATMRLATGEVVGQVVVEDDPGQIALEIPDWVAMVRSYGGTVDGPYWISVESTGGVRELRPLPATEQHPWTIPIDSDPSTVRSISVVDNRGTVWCTANLDA